MLTKTDLQAIKKAVDTSIDNRVTPLEKKVDKGLKKLEKMDRSMKWGFKNARRENGVILNYLEVEDRKIKDRVERLEHHVGFSVVN